MSHPTTLARFAVTGNAFMSSTSRPMLHLPSLYAHVHAVLRQFRRVALPSGTGLMLLRMRSPAFPARRKQYPFIEPHTQKINGYWRRPPVFFTSLHPARTEPPERRTSWHIVCMLPVWRIHPDRPIRFFCSRCPRTFAGGIPIRDDPRWINRGLRAWRITCQVHGPDRMARKKRVRFVSGGRLVMDQCVKLAAASRTVPGTGTQLSAARKSPSLYSIR